MIYYTGDIHGNPYPIIEFCENMDLTEDDVIVILGDVGLNYDLGKRDALIKQALSKLKPTIFCIHGNHECRPHQIDTYKQAEYCGGIVWYEDDYPNLKFAKDGEIYSLGEYRHLVIGGAYSVDKYYRQMRGMAWWKDEQPSKEIKARVEQQIRDNPNIDIVLSHTCPQKYVPTEMFLSGIDQSTVDTSTEEWLDTIEEQLEYRAWFCGHWHTDKSIDKMHFLYETFEDQSMLQFDEIQEMQQQ